MKTTKLLLLLPLFLPLSTSAYNLDPEVALIFQAPHTDRSNSTYFGYDVILVPGGIIVGAPKANYTGQQTNEVSTETGAAYNCSAKSARCVAIEMKDPDDENGFVSQVQLNTLIQKKRGWFGAALALVYDKNNETLLTICAPRTMVRLYNSREARYDETMHGVCYEKTDSPDRVAFMDKNFSSFDFSSKYWYNPLNGFAVHYPRQKSSRKMGERRRAVIGSPTHELYGTVHVLGQINFTELPISNALTQFGYALTSGYYFHEDLSMVAGAAPAWQFVGQVAIMDPRTDPPSIIATIEGKEVGEYFGASLATGDINNDGLDDLIVGAPHWQNDNGRVHIYLGNKAGFFEADLFIDGRVDDALFGYAITSGDLDGDGFDDIIIAAPWEESGVIYVYNGDAKIASDNDREIIPMLEPSQRIVGSSISENIRRFGFSLAKPVDVDGNGFLDIGVGAYGSGHAVIIRSKPVVRTEILLTHMNNMTQQSKQFLLFAVVFHYEKNKLTKHNYTMAYTIDEEYKRIAYDQLEYIVNDTILASHGVVISVDKFIEMLELFGCNNSTTWKQKANSLWLLAMKRHPNEETKLMKYSFDEFRKNKYFHEEHEQIIDETLVTSSINVVAFTTLAGIRNFVDPINIAVTHKLASEKKKKKEPSCFDCKLDPIEYKGVPSITARSKLPFDIGCGADHVCRSSISAKLEFEGLRGWSWIIGSGDVRLIFAISNHAEPAYLTTVTFTIPEGIALRSILPSCQEEKHGTSLNVTCDVGNPLEINVEKKISLDLDMSRMHNASLDGIELSFHADINTRSVNIGERSVHASFTPKAQFSVALSGKAHDDSYYFNYIEKPSSVILQHAYQISRFGATTISEARLIVQIPFKLGDLEFLTILHEPRISVLGRFHKCAVSSGISVAKPRIDFIETPNDSETKNGFNFDAIAKRPLTRRSISEENDRARTDTIAHGILEKLNESTRTQNTLSEFYAMPDSENADNVYLNCSTPNVSCGDIVCEIPPLKATQEAVKLQIRLLVDNAKLNDDSTSRERILHLTTEARLDVPNPLTHFVNPETSLVVLVKTKFHRAPQKSTVSIWIILVSIFLGLLVSGFLGFALWKVGFFKRNEKEKLESLKKSEAIPLDSDDIYI